MSQAVAGHRRIALLVAVMTGVAIGVGGITLYALYTTAFEQQRQRLIETVQMEVQLMEAVARFDAEYSAADVPGGAFAATMGQIREAHRGFGGFGETGGFALANRQGDDIVFLLAHRDRGAQDSLRIPWNSGLAEPMRRALRGESGTVVGQDYRGEVVLAAYEPVDVLDLGMVAKIDLAEIRAPFINAAFLAGAGALLLIALATVAFRRIGGPLVLGLEESEARNRAILDSALDAVVTMDTSGRITDWNPRAEVTFGWTRDEVVGRQMAETIIPPRYRPAHREGVRRYLETGEGPILGKRIELTALHRDGHEFPVELALSPLQVGGQRVFSAFVEDISERKHAEEAEQQRQKRLEEQQTALARLGASDALHRRDVNAALCEITEVAGRTLEVARTSVWLFNETHSKITCADLYELSESRHSKGGDLLAADYPNYFAALESERVIAADDAHGDPRTRELSASYLTPLGITSMLDAPIRMGGRGVGVVCHEHVGPRREWSTEEQNFAGSIGNMVSLALERNERRKVQETLRQVQKMEAIGQLVAGIAHDFNNLLSVVRSNAELLAMELRAAPAEQLKGIADIEAAAASGATLIRQLMGFSRHADLVLEPIDLQAAVRDAVAMLRHVVPETIEIETAWEEDLEPLRADAVALQQILLNLGTNARDAMPQGGKLRIAVSAATFTEDDRETHPWVAPGSYACISVRDTGIGMDRATQAQVFEPFFTTKPTGRGTGMGLAMVYGLVKQHSGYIHLYSEPGRGTQFKLYFPIEPVAAARIQPVRRPSGPLQFGTETILLVEDQEALRATARRALEKLGYTVIATRDGVEALQEFGRRAEQVDVILADIVMPRLGGAELVDAVRRTGRSPSFVLMSGYAGAELERGVLGGGVVFLQKPWTLAELASAVRAALAAAPPAPAEVRE